MLNGDHFSDGEEVSATIIQVTDADVDVQGHPQVHHVFFGDCRVGYVQIRDDLVFSQKRHQRADIARPHFILAQVEHFKLLVLLDRFSQGVHERLQFLKIDKM